MCDVLRNKQLGDYFVSGIKIILNLVARSTFSDADAH